MIIPHLIRRIYTTWIISSVCCLKNVGYLFALKKIWIMIRKI